MQRKIPKIRFWIKPSTGWCSFTQLSCPTLQTKACPYLPWFYFIWWCNVARSSSQLRSSLLCGFIPVLTFVCLFNQTATNSPCSDDRISTWAVITSWTGFFSQSVPSHYGASNTKRRQHLFWSMCPDSIRNNSIFKKVKTECSLLGSGNKCHYYY